MVLRDWVRRYLQSQVAELVLSGRVQTCLHSQVAGLVLRDWARTFLRWLAAELVLADWVRTCLHSQVAE